MNDAPPERNAPAPAGLADRLFGRLAGRLVGARSFETAALMRRTARAGDIDALGHVNNAVYLVWAQDAATAHWTTVAGDALTTKYVWVALRHEIDYRDPVLPGETVDIRTWLGRADGPRFERFVDIRKVAEDAGDGPAEDGSCTAGAAQTASRFSAKVKTVWCLIDAKSRRPRRVGRDILDAFGVDGEGVNGEGVNGESGRG